MNSWSLWSCMWITISSIDNLQSWWMQEDATIMFTMWLDIYICVCCIGFLPCYSRVNFTFFWSVFCSDVCCLYCVTMDLYVCMYVCSELYIVCMELFMNVVSLYSKSLARLLFIFLRFSFICIRFLNNMNCLWIISDYFVEFIFLFNIKHNKIYYTFIFLERHKNALLLTNANWLFYIFSKKNSMLPC